MFVLLHSSTSHIRYMESIRSWKYISKYSWLNYVSFHMLFMSKQMFSIKTLIRWRRKVKKEGRLGGTI